MQIGPYNRRGSFKDTFSNRNSYAKPLTSEGEDLSWIRSSEAANSSWERGHADVVLQHFPRV